MGPRRRCGRAAAAARRGSKSTRKEDAPLKAGGPGEVSYFARKHVRPKVGKRRVADVLEVGCADEGALREILARLPEKNINERMALMQRHEQQFCTWRLQIRLGFNILLYGLGSKRELLDDFSETLNNGGILRVNGFLRKLNAKKIVAAAAGALLRLPKTELRTCPPDELVQRIGADISGRCLYIVIHNIDGPGLRTVEDQLLLSQLAVCPNISVLASVDHINAHILWDKQLAAAFNWSLQDCTTFRRYIVESTEIPFAVAGRREEAARRGAAVVLRTLVPSAREIFRLIGEFQIEEGADQGISLPHLFRMCRERFLVSSELTLKSYLTEFRDHELVVMKKGQDGASVYCIPMANDEISTVLKEMTDGQS
eukprot:evm.model.scf_425EXC.7 EVM.evm.TU.scf_425EXC.7   scf_425EXC:38332-41699(+)